MIRHLRQAHNNAFTTAQYEAFLNHIRGLYNYEPRFRISETPVFIPDDFRDKLIEACEDIADVLCQPDFKAKSEGALKAEHRVPNEDAHTTFLVVDYGICEENGQLVPKLIELQGFPSLYFFQHDLALAYKTYFDVPKTMSPLFGGLDTEGYYNLLKEVIVGDSKPENVVLLEIEPEKQNTAIDFYSTAKHLGIKALCLTNVLKKGKKLYYKNEKGKSIRIEKIYNRVIFDELERRKDLKLGFHFSDELDVEWIGHPNWFFRISKHTMPFLKSAYVPKTYFLHEIDTNQLDLSKFVLKPLFSFSGQGVKITITQADIDAVEDKKNWIVQEKVHYAPILETPSGPTKVEIRMLMVWKKDWARPRLINNLIRLSKGEMIGVRYNVDKDWVGASVGLFNPH